MLISLAGFRVYDLVGLWFIDNGGGLLFFGHPVVYHQLYTTLFWLWMQVLKLQTAGWTEPTKWPKKSATTEFSVNRILNLIIGLTFWAPLYTCQEQTTILSVHGPSSAWEWLYIPMYTFIWIRWNIFRKCTWTKVIGWWMRHIFTPLGLAYRWC